jgi:hypothetical protein
MNKKFLSGAGGLATVALVATSLMIAAPTQAQESNFFGQCSAGNPFEFSVDRERGSIDFDFDIEWATPFERWTIRINQNGNRIVTDRMQADEDGDVDRDYVRRSSNSTQSERWVFSARSTSGNLCSASVTLNTPTLSGSQTLVGDFDLDIDNQRGDGTFVSVESVDSLGRNVFVVITDRSGQVLGSVKPALGQQMVTVPLTTQLRQSQELYGSLYLDNGDGVFSATTDRQLFDDDNDLIDEDFDYVVTDSQL